MPLCSIEPRTSKSLPPEFSTDLIIERLWGEGDGVVAQGLTNKAIAGRLFLSERTAQNQVQHILNSLGASSRAQIATWYARR